MRGQNKLRPGLVLLASGTELAAACTSNQFRIFKYRPHHHCFKATPPTGQRAKQQFEAKTRIPNKNSSVGEKVEYFRKEFLGNATRGISIFCRLGFALWRANTSTPPDIKTCRAYMTPSTNDKYVNYAMRSPTGKGILMILLLAPITHHPYPGERNATTGGS